MLMGGRRSVASSALASTKFSHTRMESSRFRTEKAGDVGRQETCSSPGSLRELLLVCVFFF